MAFIGSLLIHAALVAALIFSVNASPPEPPVVQAELWSSLPALQPASAPTPQSPPSPEEPKPEPSPEPPAEKSPATAPATVGPTEDEIALEKKRQIQEQERKNQEAEKAKTEKEARDREARERLAKEKQAKEKQLADKKAAEEKARLEKARKEQAQQERIRQEEARKKRQAEQLEAQRRAELARLGIDPKAKPADAGKDRATKAGVTGGAEIGDRSGVLADYAAAIRARIRARITFDPSRAPNNPEVIFEVIQLPTGQISAVTMKKSSGNTGWDAAVERAIRASSPLPKASDGTVERLLELRFRPQDPA